MRTILHDGDLFKINVFRKTVERCNGEIFFICDGQMVGGGTVSAELGVTLGELIDSFKTSISGLTFLYASSDLEGQNQLDEDTVMECTECTIYLQMKLEPVIIQGNFTVWNGGTNLGTLIANGDGTGSFTLADGTTVTGTVVGLSNIIGFCSEGYTVVFFGEEKSGAIDASSLFSDLRTCTYSEEYAAVAGVYFCPAFSCNITLTDDGKAIMKAVGIVNAEAYEVKEDGSITFMGMDFTVDSENNRLL